MLCSCLMKLRIWRLMSAARVTGWLKQKCSYKTEMTNLLRSHKRDHKILPKRIYLCWFKRSSHIVKFENAQISGQQNIRMNWVTVSSYLNTLFFLLCTTGTIKMITLIFCYTVRNRSEEGYRSATSFYLPMATLTSEFIISSIDMLQRVRI